MDMLSEHDWSKAAAWLYAQFMASKTTSLKKSMVGLTPIRESDIQSQAMTEVAAKLGGLVEFYRSPARVAWTPTGTNVPDYPKLAQLWWQNVSAGGDGREDAAGGDGQAGQGDGRRAGTAGARGDEELPAEAQRQKDPKKWLSDKQAPWAKLANEKPKGETIAYETLLKAWKEGRVR